MDLAQVLDLDTHDERAVRANGNLDFGLERLVDRSWQVAVPVPQEILYCVPPNTTWERKRREVDVAPLPGRRFTRRDRKDLWRFVMRDVQGQQVASQAFQLGC